MSSPVLCGGMKLILVLFLGFFLPPLIVVVFSCTLFCFFLFLPILCVLSLVVLEYKILVKRPFRYVAMSLVNVCLWVLDDWSKTHEMFLEGVKDNQVSVELDPLEFPNPDESEDDLEFQNPDESDDEEEQQRAGVMLKNEESQSQTLQPQKSFNRELYPFYNVLSFWKTKETEDVGKSLKLEKRNTI